MEANVLVVENPDDPASPTALTPVECRFPPGERFKHFDLKWIDWEGLSWHRVQDRELARRLREASCRVFAALGGVSYARCDFRVDRDSGEIRFLEINPNCAIFYPPDVPGSADFVLQIDPMGVEGFVDRIIRAAMIRAGGRGGGERSRWRVIHRGRRGYALVAAVPLEEGDLIMRGEEMPYYLVSAAHAGRAWDEQKQEALRRYAWPLADGLFAMWAPRPDEWRPLNHSCDPNAWFSEEGGLDVYARRAIAEGEEITMDYATFCGADTEPFMCDCGSALCRGTIRGSDCLQPFVAERYGTRLSAFVRTLRRG